MSDQAFSLISKLLLMDPNQRLELKDALTHPFYYTEEQKPLQTDFIEVKGHRRKRSNTHTNLLEIENIAEQ